MPRLIGLRNTVTDGSRWRYLFFFDYDDPDMLTPADEEILQKYDLPYVYYSTKHGKHLIVLEALDAYDWGLLMQRWAIRHDSYYSGQTIRLSRKENEEQKLIRYWGNTKMLSNLYSIYQKRFNLPPAGGITGWKLVFETYRSKKE